MLNVYADVAETFIGFIVSGQLKQHSRQDVWLPFQQVKKKKNVAFF